MPLKTSRWNAGAITYVLHMENENRNRIENRNEKAKKSFALPDFVIFFVITAIVLLFSFGYKIIKNNILINIPHFHTHL
jgi:hypothetical protein